MGKMMGHVYLAIGNALPGTSFSDVCIFPRQIFSILKGTLTRIILAFLSSSIFKSVYF
jgi:hypothetical protein